MNVLDGKQMKNWQPYVGKRCIVIENRYSASGMEVTVLETSPKGRVKFKFSSGSESWQDKQEYLLIEVLEGGEENG